VPKNASPREEPEAQFIQMAVRAVDNFHSAVSKNDPSAVCANAEPHAFDAVTKLACPQFVALLNNKLGAFSDSKRTQTPLASAKPALVGLVYQSHYQRGDGRERFTYRFEGGRAILTVYRITSDALTR
jgi:hypothetical protein